MVERQIKIIVNGKEREASKRNVVVNNDEPIMVKQRLSSPLKPKKRKYRHFNKKLKQVWVSALVALGIGATFGLIMLSLFTGEHSIIDKAEGKVTNNAAKVSDETTLELSVSLIQGGAYQTLQSASNIKDQIIKDGYAAIVDENEEPYRLYMGIGTKKEHLQTLISEYETYGQETYVKRIDIVPNEKFTDEEKQLLAEGKDLLLAFIMDTERLLNGQSIQDREVLSKKLLAWKSEIESKWSENEEVINFVHALQETDRAIQAYIDEKKAKQLWTMENSLLHAFLFYKNIVSEN